MTLTNGQPTRYERFDCIDERGHWLWLYFHGDFSLDEWADFMNKHFPVQP